MSLIFLLACSAPESVRHPEKHQHHMLKTIGAELKITASDASTNDEYGYLSARAGDLNGDGYSDVLVATSGDGDNGDLGVVYVYYGSSGGLDTTTEERLSGFETSGSILDVRDWISGAGDVNGDGYNDVIIGAPREDTDGYSSKGAAYVYYGSSSGLDGTSADKITFSDSNSYADFGCAVSGAGDVDGDGYDDVIVGATGYVPQDGYDVGGAFVYYGSSSGISSSEDRIIASNSTLYDYFGADVASAGDLNGDGYDDVLVAALDKDPYIYYGSSSGIDTDTEVQLDDGGLGPLAGAGDLNGDGYDDIAVGCWYGLCAGVYIYYGGAAGVDVTDGTKLNTVDGAVNIDMGIVIDAAGDVNADGYADVVVGAPDDDDNGSNSGAIYVYYGSSAGLSSSNGEKVLASDGASEDSFGTSVAGVGDVNGDGYDELLTGAPDTDDNGSNSGAAYIYQADCTDMDADGVCESSDCDDDDASVGAATLEVCDGTDNDCDGLTDGADDDVSDASTWYIDSDSDGYGDADISMTACDQPSGYTDNDGDCDDSDNGIHPDAEDVIGDGIDQDCDGIAPQADDDGESSDEDKGCSVGPRRAAPTGGLWLLMLTGLALRRRR